MVNRDRFLTTALSILKQAVGASVILFRITIPILILTRILSELGLIEYLGHFLAPAMEWVGLPGTMGLVWGAAILTNLYTGAVVFASIAPAESLSVAQVTVLSAMMLVAHALPVELRIAQKAGPRLRAMIVIRLGGALLLGFILYHLYRVTGTLQTPGSLLWQPATQHSGWLDWALNETIKLGAIFLIILSLISLMRLLEYLKIMALLIRILQPLMKMLGISQNAAPLTIIGMTMGIGYGGGLLIQEVKTGKLDAKDLFFSFSLMGLCHSIVEDTLLMMVIGGHLSGILWGRLAFTLLVTFLLVKAFAGVSPAFFDRFFFRQPQR
jgi:hypothetical protein